MADVPIGKLSDGSSVLPLGRSSVSELAKCRRSGRAAHEGGKMKSRGDCLLLGSSGVAANATGNSQPGKQARPQFLT